MAVLRTQQTKRRDLLDVPVVGRFLRWKHARTSLQAVLLAVSALILYDGFWGPQLAPKNLAGVLPWVHWRGFVVLALLIAGNIFCMACPFMLPRRLAKKLLPADRSWPRLMRNKWLAIGVLLLFFWAYEAFDLWASPWLTAWVALTYFVAAFAIDGIFKGAAFCKYVCPIGQFHFVHGMVSPLEVKVRQPDICGACPTKDCISGRYGPIPEPSPVIPAQAGIQVARMSPGTHKSGSISVIPAKARPVPGRGIHLQVSCSRNRACRIHPGHLLNRQETYLLRPVSNSSRPAASCGSFKNAKSATWTVPSASTAFRPVPTTTSASSSALPPASFVDWINCIPASAC